MRHLRSVEIAGSEIELPHSVSSKGIAFNLVVPIPFVLSENNPGSLRDQRKPSFIRRSRSKKVSVASILYAVGYQGFDDGLAVVQILIQVEDEIVKLQLLGFPSGLPLRSALLRGHIP